MSIFPPYKYIMIRMTWEAKSFRILRFIEVQCQKLEILGEMALASAHGLPLFPPFLDCISSPSTSHKQLPFGQCPALGMCIPAM